MSNLAAQIAALTDQQALSVLDSLAGEFATDETPEGQQEQAKVLKPLLEQEGQAIDLSQISQVEVSTAAASARQVLLMMSQVPEIEPSLIDWLENPPKQETASINQKLLAPVVLTGCVVLLQVVGHLNVTACSNGDWEVRYDPTVETPLDKSMKDIAEILVDLTNSIPTGG